MSNVGRPKGLPKTGGRKPGVPNKKTKEFKEVLDKHDFNIAEEALKLFKSTENPLLQFKILEFLSSYSFPKPRYSDQPEEVDVTDTEPVDEDMSSEELLKIAKQEK